MRNWIWEHLVVPVICGIGHTVGFISGCLLAWRYKRGMISARELNDAVGEEIIKE